MCSGCHEEKPANEYYRQADSSDGLQGTCIICQKAYKAKWRDANKEHIRADGRRYRRENHEKVKAAAYRWKNANKERVHKNQTEWVRANPDKVRRKEKRWGAANPDTLRAKWARHWARRRAITSDGDFTAEQWIAKKDYFNNCCAYCFTETTLEIEHVIPVSRGGLHTDENIVPACRSCNSSKGAKLIEEWLVA